MTRLAWFRIPAVAAALAFAAGASGQTYQLNSTNQVESGFFGGSVAGVQDLNGDNRGDIIVGAPGEGPNGTTTFAGRVYVYSGATNTLLRTIWSPNSQPYGYFGDSVAGVPDVNGDGRGDILVGAPGESYGTGPAGAGRAYLFSGANGALLRTFFSPDQETNGSFGDCVAGIPDVNGDGRGDIIIGAPEEDPGSAPSGAGRAYIFSGASGVLLRILASPHQETDGAFGCSVSGIPDVNGDGRGDVIVGAKRENPGSAPVDSGRAYIFSGATGVRLRTLNSPGQEIGGSFGESVSGIPDVNGDGRGDVVVGSPDEDPGSSPVGCGRANVYSGATGALLWKLLPPTPEIDGNFGVAVAGAPDMNGDGRGEIIVGAWNEDPGTSPSNCGRVHVYSGLTGKRIWTFASTAPQIDGAFGIAVAGVPDLNANGKGDIVVGAVGENSPGSPIYAGRAYIIRR